MWNTMQNQVTQTLQMKVHTDKGDQQIQVINKTLESVKGEQE